MRGQAGFFDLDERLQELSAKGDTLERLNGQVDSKRCPQATALRLGIGG